jgi:hypothetical protein
MLTSIPRGRVLARTAIVACVVMLAFAVGTRASASAATTAVSSTASIVNNQKRVCLYDANYISGLATFAAMVGRQTIDCGMVYTGSPDWAGWVDPWFLHHPDPDLNWAAWVRASPANDRRQLIISQPLIPSQLSGDDWRDACAHGDYTRYAKQFATNLVNDGVSDAVIRLSWEMNGTWNIDSIGTSPGDYAKWIQCYRQTALAMKSVAGQHFVFDWCPNNGVRNIPLASYYPGDDVVDIIGDDAYDAGVPATATDRWSVVDNRAQGLATILAFAQAHHKPMSLPEWGVGVATSANLAGNDDPTYINQIAKFVADNDVAFQTYFYAHEWATQLQTGPRSLAAFRSAFGTGGSADAFDNGTDLTPVTRFAPVPAKAAPTKKPAKKLTKQQAKARAARNRAIAKARIAALELAARMTFDINR